MFSQPVGIFPSYEWNGIQASYKKSREKLDRYFPGPLVEKAAAEGRAAGLEGINNVSQRGDRLAAIETGYTVTDLVKEVYPLREKEVNVDYLPPPDITYIPHELNFEIRPRGQIVDFWG